MSKPGNDHTRYEVIVQEADDGTDDLVIPIPPILLEELGWKEGDDIDFSVDEKGRWFLRKISK